MKAKPLHFKDQELKPLNEATSQLEAQSSEITAEQIGYSSKSIMLVCTFLFFLDILINLDHGALPAASVSIKTDLKMENVWYGTMGSLVFLGLVIGSLASTFIFGWFSSKMILVLAFVGNGAGLICFIVFRDFFMMGFGRFMSGFF
jgi:MFS family permease